MNISKPRITTLFMAGALTSTFDLASLPFSLPFYGLIGSGTLANPTVQQGQLLLPFPQYTSVAITGPSNRDSIYHSLQMKMEKRFHGGGTVLVAYTGSKLISNTDTVTTWLDATGTFQ